MPLVGHAVHQFWGYNQSGSITVNRVPAYILAQVGFYDISGEGLHVIGIKKYRHRPTVDGPETDVDFGSFWAWPSTIGGPRISSVTFGIALGSHEGASAYGNLYWWS